MLKAFEKTKLTSKELETLPLDIKITLNNQLLGYIEDPIHTPILTTNLMILEQQYFALKGDAAGNTEDCDLKK